MPTAGDRPQMPAEPKSVAAEAIAQQDGNNASFPIVTGQSGAAASSAAHRPSNANAVNPQQHQHHQQRARPKPSLFRSIPLLFNSALLKASSASAPAVITLRMRADVGEAADGSAADGEDASAPTSAQQKSNSATTAANADNDDDDYAIKRADDGDNAAPKVSGDDNDNDDNADEDEAPLTLTLSSFKAAMRNVSTLLASLVSVSDGGFAEEGDDHPSEAVVAKRRAALCRYLHSLTRFGKEGFVSMLPPRELLTLSSLLTRLEAAAADATEAERADVEAANGAAAAEGGRTTPPPQPFQRGGAGKVMAGLIEASNSISRLSQPLTAKESGPSSAAGGSSGASGASHPLSQARQTLRLRQELSIVAKSILLASEVNSQATAERLGQQVQTDLLPRLTLCLAALHPSKGTLVDVIPLRSVVELLWAIVPAIVTVVGSSPSSSSTPASALSPATLPPPAGGGGGQQLPTSPPQPSVGGGDASASTSAAPSSASSSVLAVKSSHLLLLRASAAVIEAHTVRAAQLRALEADQRTRLADLRQKANASPPADASSASSSLAAIEEQIAAIVATLTVIRGELSSTRAAIRAEAEAAVGGFWANASAASERAALLAYSLLVCPLPLSFAGAGSSAHSSRPTSPPSEGANEGENDDTAEGGDAQQNKALPPSAAYLLPDHSVALLKAFVAPFSHRMPVVAGRNTLLPSSQHSSTPSPSSSTSEEAVGSFILMEGRRLFHLVVGSGDDLSLDAAAVGPRDVGGAGSPRGSMLLAGSPSGAGGGIMSDAVWREVLEMPQQTREDGGRPSGATPARQRGGGDAVDESAGANGGQHSPLRGKKGSAATPLKSPASALRGGAGGGDAGGDILLRPFRYAASSASPWADSVGSPNRSAASILAAAASRRGRTPLLHTGDASAPVTDGAQQQNVANPSAAKRPREEANTESGDAVTKAQHAAEVTEVHTAADATCQTPLAQQREGGGGGDASAVKNSNASAAANAPDAQSAAKKIRFEDQPQPNPTLTSGAATAIANIAANAPASLAADAPASNNGPASPVEADGGAQKARSFASSAIPSFLLGPTAKTAAVYSRSGNRPVNVSVVGSDGTTLRLSAAAIAEAEAAGTTVSLNSPSQGADAASAALLQRGPLTGSVSILSGQSLLAGPTSPLGGGGGGGGINNNSNSNTALASSAQQISGGLPSIGISSSVLLPPPVSSAAAILGAPSIGAGGHGILPLAATAGILGGIASPTGTGGSLFSLDGILGGAHPSAAGAGMGGIGMGMGGPSSQHRGGESGCLMSPTGAHVGDVWGAHHPSLSAVGSANAGGTGTPPSLSGGPHSAASAASATRALVSLMTARPPRPTPPPRPSASAPSAGEEGGGDGAEGAADDDAAHGASLSSAPSQQQQQQLPSYANGFVPDALRLALNAVLATTRGNGQSSAAPLSGDDAATDNANEKGPSSGPSLSANPSTASAAAFGVAEALCGGEEAAAALADRLTSARTLAGAIARSVTCDCCGDLPLVSPLSYSKRYGGAALGAALPSGVGAGGGGGAATPQQPLTPSQQHPSSSASSSGPFAAFAGGPPASTGLFGPPPSATSGLLARPATASLLEAPTMAALGMGMGPNGGGAGILGDGGHHHHHPSSAGVLSHSGGPASPHRQPLIVALAGIAAAVARRAALPSATPLGSGSKSASGTPSSVSAAAKSSTAGASATTNSNGTKVDSTLRFHFSVLAAMFPLRFGCCGSLQCPSCCSLDRCAMCGEESLIPEQQRRLMIALIAAAAANGTSAAAAEWIAAERKKTEAEMAKAGNDGASNGAGGASSPSSPSALPADWLPSALPSLVTIAEIALETEVLSNAPSSASAAKAPSSASPPLTARAAGETPPMTATTAQRSASPALRSSTPSAAASVGASGSATAGATEAPTLLGLLFEAVALQQRREAEAEAAVNAVTPQLTPQHSATSLSAPRNGSSDAIGALGQSMTAVAAVIATDDDNAHPHDSNGQQQPAVLWEEQLCCPADVSLIRSQMVVLAKEVLAGL